MCQGRLTTVKEVAWNDFTEKITKTTSSARSNRGRPKLSVNDESRHAEKVKRVVDRFTKDEGTDAEAFADKLPRFWQTAISVNLYGMPIH